MKPPAMHPELGPRVAFFTGGTALRDLSRALIRHTHNSVHLITPFDSGGSSAALRRAFDMPAVGDIRNRLLALADTTLASEGVLNVCAARLPAEGDRTLLLRRLYSLASEKDAAWTGTPPASAKILRLYLRCFLENMPEDFDPCLASVGNLILAGGYIRHGGRLDPALRLMTRLLRARGTVLPIVSRNLHLAARLADGSLVVGQHRITRGPLPAPITRLFLTARSPDAPRADAPPCRPRIAAAAADGIRAADVLCYPMGSFYTSVLANLLPRGVGAAVAEARCPKLYISNTGNDPEQTGLSVAGTVRVLLDALRADAGDLPARRLLGAVLVDARHGRYPQGIDAEGVAAMGVRVLDLPVVRPDDPARHDPEMTTEALLGLANEEADGGSLL